MYENLKKKIALTFKKLEEMGLNYGSSGNISVKVKEGLYLITPSGLRKSLLRPKDILLINSKGEVVEGSLNPSSEYRLHLKIYESRKDVNAIIHAHPIYSTAFAVSGKEIPIAVEETAICTGGPVSVADYSPAGSEELAENALKALGEKGAVLLRNHGVVTCGTDLDEALDTLVCVERAAQIVYISKTLGGYETLPSEVVENEKEIYKIKRGL